MHILIIYSCALIIYIKWIYMIISIRFRLMYALIIYFGKLFMKNWKSYKKKVSYFFIFP